MRRVVCWLAVFLLASVALAADATGKWHGAVPGREGQSYPNTFDLKVEGGKLTGRMVGEQVDVPILDGKVSGDEISFRVELEFGDGIKLSFKGKVSGEEIKFTVERQGEPPVPFTAKRVS